MPLIPCTHQAHAQAILEILNHAIETSTALYDYAPRPLSSMREWFDTKAAKGFPVIGAIDTDGTLMGFATYGTWRALPAYKYSVEHSVYIHHQHRGKGLATQLMQALIEAARAQDMHMMIAAIDTTNTASIALHQKLGFAHAGTVGQAGFKFGRWLDVAFYQRILDTPASPTAG